MESHFAEIRQRPVVAKSVVRKSLLGQFNHRAYVSCDSARGWTAADITRTGGREDGAGPLLAAALDRSSGVGCFRDHIAADLVTVADAPREGLRSKPLSCAPVARTSLRIFGNGRLSPRMYLRKEFRDGWGQARRLPSDRRRGGGGGREMESDRFWLLVSFWLLLVIGAVTMLVIVLANRP
jgi:hypothetical protein